MITKSDILKEFEIFHLKTGGIGNWLVETTDFTVFQRLGQLDKEPLSKVQLNQLLLLSLEAGVSFGFFDYYWLNAPLSHPYDVTLLPDFEKKWVNNDAFAIVSLGHLKWGLYRLYVDCLLFFGDVRNGYRMLRTKTKDDLVSFFRSKCFKTETFKKRGPALPLLPIPKDHRYLIAERACKSYGANPTKVSDLKEALREAWKDHQTSGGGRITVRELLNGSQKSGKLQDRYEQLTFSADEILEEDVSSEQDIEKKYLRLAELFSRTREAALQNTKLYLSMVNDLDVYVATSMRKRHDFRTMAESCDVIFGDERLRGMNVRYFDPTLSAAEGHEDKGLIECLMVKCAKVLVYCAGDSETYGKDAEAAMALSLGKPVIFYCPPHRAQLYRDVHPLTRLIQFETGVAVGAMVTSNIHDVSELLCRLFENKMSYYLEQRQPGSLRLVEGLTKSVVRLQTNDTLLSQTFWNYYHNRPER
jgi:hypothetical protein